jgi:predicted glycosyltransferase
VPSDLNILVDIGHPAHVHFFLNPILKWQKHGCRIFITSRRKEIATDLLDALNIQHQIISSLGRGGIFHLGKELISRNHKLLQVISSFKPDIMVGIGGIFIAQTGFLRRIPSIVFYNLMTYPFCSLVAVPECYSSWLPPWHLRYPGYHELSYLHPNVFKPDLNTAITCGLDPDKKNFLIRTVSWQASHDLHDFGWNIDLLTKTVNFLNQHGNVIISAEGELPPSLQSYAYQGPKEKIHHLMAHLSMFIGESATMASECAVLGVPAIYAANTGRGYTDEQEAKYNLVVNVRKLQWPKIKKAMTDILDIPPETWQEKRAALLAEKINVAEFVSELVLRYPRSVKEFQKNFSSPGSH